MGGDALSRTEIMSDELKQIKNGAPETVYVIFRAKSRKKNEKQKMKTLSWFHMTNLITLE